MKLFGKVLLAFFALIILVPVFILGFLGFMPGLSSFLGTDKPKNLGIVYTEADRTSARAKSQIIYANLPENTPAESSVTRTGSHPVSAEFSSAEVTALMNNRPWKYWPYKDVQIKFNSDGSTEISGIFLKDRLVGYGQAIAAPAPAITFAAKILPANPVFYVKGRAALQDNHVSVFEPQSFQLGKIPLPVDLFLAFAPPQLVDSAHAEADLSDLGRIKNKKTLIIDYINSRLSTFSGFFAKSAYFTEDKLVFDGSLPDTLSYSQ